MKQKKAKKKSSSLLLFLGIPVIVGIILLFIITQYKQITIPKAATNDPNLTIVTVDTDTIITPVVPRFTGISFEMSNVCDVIKWSQQSDKFNQLLKNLGPQIARFGGNTGDKALWAPDGTAKCSAEKTVLNRSVVDSLFTLFAKANWKLIWTVNLANYAPTTYSKEADYVIKTGGSNLYALGIGNEPDLYSSNGNRPSTYTYENFLNQWNAYKKIILQEHPNVHLMGNDSCCKKDWITKYTSDSSSLSMLTQHFYATSNTGTGVKTPTVENLLSANLMKSSMITMDTYVQLAKSKNLPLGIIETNSTSGGGKAGLSNTYAATLWASDYMFSALEHGVRHLNFHTGISPSIYSPIDRNVNPTALYYSFLFYKYGAPSGFVVKTTIQSPSNVAAHAVLLENGSVRVSILNKDLNKKAITQIRLPKVFKKATALRLTAPSVTATSGITFGRAAVDSSGKWSPSTAESIVLSDKTATVSLLALEGLVVDFSL